MCTNCGSEHVTFGTYETVCRVCELVDGDTSEKGCALCKVCGQYICGKCWYNGPRRAMAAMLNCGEKVVEGVNNILRIFKS